VIAFLSHVPFTEAWTEVLALLGLVTLLGGLFKHLECHRAGCHRWGRYPHGHFKLCRLHHPQVPNDGKVRAEHIAAVAKHEDRVMDRVDKVGKSVRDLHDVPPQPPPSSRSGKAVE
jgi:hypothetical protein